MKKRIALAALRDTLPVLTGYLVLGAGFGLLLGANGFGIWWAVGMSLFIYAGSMQYAAVGLLTGGVSLLAVGLSTLAINARHLFYGISMTEEYRGTGRSKPYLVFGLTDETYSLVCRAGVRYAGEEKRRYFFFVTLFDHIYWVAGSAIGSLLGEALPLDFTGIDFALTAMFLVTFLDQWRSGEGHHAALSGLSASLLCLLLFGADNFLLPAMGLILLLLLLGRGLGKGAIPRE